MLNRIDRVIGVVVVTCSVIFGVCLAGGEKKSASCYFNGAKFKCQYENLMYLNSMHAVTLSDDKQNEEHFLLCTTRDKVSRSDTLVEYLAKLSMIEGRRPESYESIEIVKCSIGSVARSEKMCLNMGKELLKKFVENIELQVKYALETAQRMHVMPDPIEMSTMKKILPTQKKNKNTDLAKENTNVHSFAAEFRKQPQQEDAFLGELRETGDFDLGDFSMVIHNVLQRKKRPLGFEDDLRMLVEHLYLVALKKSPKVGRMRRLRKAVKSRATKITEETAFKFKAAFNKKKLAREIAQASPSQANNENDDPYNLAIIFRRNLERQVYMKELVVGEEYAALLKSEYLAADTGVEIPEVAAPVKNSVAQFEETPLANVPAGQITNPAQNRIPRKSITSSPTQQQKPSSIQTESDTTPKALPHEETIGTDKVMNSSRPERYSPLRSDAQQSDVNAGNSEGTEPSRTSVASTPDILQPTIAPEKAADNTPKPAEQSAPPLEKRTENPLPSDVRNNADKTTPRPQSNSSARRSAAQPSGQNAGNPGGIKRSGTPQQISGRADVNRGPGTNEKTPPLVDHKKSDNIISPPAQEKAAANTPRAAQQSPPPLDKRQTTPRPQSNSRARRSETPGRNHGVPGARNKPNSGVRRTNSEPLLDNSGIDMPPSKTDNPPEVRQQSLPPEDQLPKPIASDKTKIKEMPSETPVEKTKPLHTSEREQVNNKNTEAELITREPVKPVGDSLKTSLPLQSKPIAEDKHLIKPEPPATTVEKRGPLLTSEKESVNNKKRPVQNTETELNTKDHSVKPVNIGGNIETTLPPKANPIAEDKTLIEPEPSKASVEKRGPLLTSEKESVNNKKQPVQNTETELITEHPSVKPVGGNIETTLPAETKQIAGDETMFEPLPSEAPVTNTGSLSNLKKDPVGINKQPGQKAKAELDTTRLFAKPVDGNSKASLPSKANPITGDKTVAVQPSEKLGERTQQIPKLEKQPVPTQNYVELEYETNTRNPPVEPVDGITETVPVPISKKMYLKREREETIILNIVQTVADNAGIPGVYTFKAENRDKYGVLHQCHVRFQETASIELFKMDLITRANEFEDVWYFGKSEVYETTICYKFANYSQEMHGRATIKEVEINAIPLNNIDLSIIFTLELRQLKYRHFDDDEQNAFHGNLKNAFWWGQDGILYMKGFELAVINGGKYKNWTNNHSVADSGLLYGDYQKTRDDDKRPCDSSSSVRSDSSQYSYIDSASEVSASEIDVKGLGYSDRNYASVFDQEQREKANRHEDHLAYGEIAKSKSNSSDNSGLIYGKFYPKLKTLPLHGLLKYAGDINAIAKRFIETGEHSSETELQAYVLAKLSEFGVECFPKEYKRLTMDDYSFKFGEADFYQKTDRIEAAIYNFQHPQQMRMNFEYAYKVRRDQWPNILKLACLWLNSSNGYMGKSYVDMMNPPPIYVVEEWAAAMKTKIPINYTEQPSQVLELFELIDYTVRPPNVRQY